MKYPEVSGFGDYQSLEEKAKFTNIPLFTLCYIVMFVISEGLTMMMIVKRILIDFLSFL